MVWRERKLPLSLFLSLPLSLSRCLPRSLSLYLSISISLICSFRRDLSSPEALSGTVTGEPRLKENAAP